MFKSKTRSAMIDAFLQKGSTLVTETRGPEHDAGPTVLRHIHSRSTCSFHSSEVSAYYAKDSCFSPSILYPIMSNNCYSPFFTVFSSFLLGGLSFPHYTHSVVTAKPRRHRLASCPTRSLALISLATEVTYNIYENQASRRLFGS